MTEDDFMDRLAGRVAMLVGNGVLTAGSDAGAAQHHQVKLGADEVRDNTLRIAEWGFASMPLPGATAVVLFVGGDRSDGVIVATHDQRYRISLAPGEVAIHDDQGQKVHLTRDGIVISSPKKIRFEAPEIQLHATTLLQWDVNGHGQVWHPTSVDTWQIGETPGTSHNISPPEIP